MEYKRIGIYEDVDANIRNKEGKRLGYACEHKTAFLSSGEYTREEIEIYIKMCVDRFFKIDRGMITLEIEKDTVFYNVLDGIRIIKDSWGTYSVRCYEPSTGNYEEVEIGIVKTKSRIYKDLLHFFSSTVEKFELNVYSRYTS